MIQSLKSGVLIGSKGRSVTIEISAGGGIPGLHIVGLPDLTIKESRDRIRIALKQCGFQIPNKKFTVNLLPADLKKQGSQLDLALAAAVLKACDIPIIGKSDWGYVGEIALTGEIRSFKSSYNIIEGMIEAGCSHIVLPKACQSLKQAFPSQQFYFISRLEDLMVYANKEADLVGKLGECPDETECDALSDSIVINNISDEDFNDIIGHHFIKRALAAAAAGGHHVLMVGPPGTGKTMMAQRLIGILPELEAEERLEILKVQCHLDGDMPSLNSIRRPFRKPHSSMSAAGMFGGSKMGSMGEVTLAHKGVLLLDEIAEFKRDVIEGLRNPLETKQVTLSKSGYRANWPADFILIATSNPCPCGHRGYTSKCQCTDYQVNQYFSKLSGPILDRFDIKIDVHFNEYKVCNDKECHLETMGSSELRILVKNARNMQIQRFKTTKMLNAMIHPRDIKKYILMNEKAQNILNQLFQERLDSMRTLHKVQRLSRTLADLDGVEIVNEEHVLEAFQMNRRTLI